MGSGGPPSLANTHICLPPAAVLDSRQESLPTAYSMGEVHHPQLASSGQTFIVSNRFHATWHGDQAPQLLSSISLDSSPSGQEDVEAQDTAKSRQGCLLTRWAPTGLVVLFTIYLSLSTVLWTSSSRSPSSIIPCRFPTNFLVVRRLQHYFYLKDTSTLPFTFTLACSLYSCFLYALEAFDKFIFYRTPQWMYCTTQSFLDVIYAVTSRVATPPGLS